MFIDIDAYNKWIRTIRLVDTMTRSQALDTLLWGKENKVDVPSYWGITKSLQDATQIKPQWYECCINSCMAYTGDFADLTECTQKLKGTSHDCKEPHYFSKLDSHGNLKPRKRFLYIPIISRLKAQSESNQSEIMTTYRASFNNRNDSDMWRGVFDGDLY